MIHQTTVFSGWFSFSWVFYKKNPMQWDCIMINLLVSFRDLNGYSFHPFHSHLGTNIFRLSNIKTNNIMSFVLFSYRKCIASATGFLNYETREIVHFGLGAKQSGMGYWHANSQTLGFERRDRSRTRSRVQTAYQRSENTLSYLL